MMMCDPGWLVGASIDGTPNERCNERTTSTENDDSMATRTHKSFRGIDSKASRKTEEVDPADDMSISANQRTIRDTKIDVKR